MRFLLRPEITRVQQTEISDLDVKRIAQKRPLIKPNYFLFILLVSNALIFMKLLVVGMMGINPLLMSISVVVNIPFLDMQWRKLAKARAEFLKHWHDTGELYPEGWAYEYPKKEKKNK